MHPSSSTISASIVNCGLAKVVHAVTWPTAWPIENRSTCARPSLPTTRWILTCSGITADGVLFLRTILRISAVTSALPTTLM